MKTTLKLHANGDLETVNTPLIQSGTQYKFAENLITVPKIIEYPPVGYRNYFIESTITRGYLAGGWSSGVLEQEEDEISSDFINIDGWNNATIRIRYKGMNGLYPPWRRIILYAENQIDTLGFPDEGYLNIREGDYVLELKLPIDASFLRLSTNYYDTPGVEVKISVEKGLTDNSKHYLALEDLPSWVKDTGNPISFFEEGVVIKGNLIQTNN